MILITRYECSDYSNRSYYVQAHARAPHTVAIGLPGGEAISLNACGAQELLTLLEGFVRAGVLPLAEE